MFYCVRFQAKKHTDFCNCSRKEFTVMSAVDSNSSFLQEAQNNFRSIFEHVGSTSSFSLEILQFFGEDF